MMNDSKFDYIVEDSDKGLMVRELLRRKFGFSSRLMTKLKAHGGVFNNGAPAKMHLKPEAGDRITVSLPSEKSAFEPQDIKFSVVYEDADLLIVNKQPGYVVHPTKGHPSGTLANGVMKYILDTDQHFKIRFINRLDMDTSGLVVIAKNSHGQDSLSKQMGSGEVIKKYVAVVKGIMDEEEGTIDLPIGKVQEDLVMRRVREDGYPSVTHYRVIERYQKGYSLVELRLETGRTHQIRVHMSHIGHPVVGDVLYGTGAPWLIERQALHAKYLAFRHPVTGKKLEVEAELPQDMETLFDKIKKV